MRNIFFFDAMLTPKIITVVYWLLLASAFIGGLTTMFFGYNSNFIYGVALTIAGCIGARIWCELLIVLFKINSNLQKLADKVEQ
ncbi:DUF4282 domain-containing protein [Alteromonas pelagimontana]|uniref:DUF4282 domain-containing protein n=1 Tax=Alteromonas pelagimontana TaxID=1858656 RepID=A0A6M4MAU2_9ALTE|nr:DUF4282 domain-containing protein [Alteromonas pelagimontana]QJR80304.1 DUF4282 domain-containing protein [Alteromonas pelagimontana]